MATTLVPTYPDHVPSLTGAHLAVLTDWLTSAMGDADKACDPEDHANEGDGLRPNVRGLRLTGRRPGEASRQLPDIRDHTSAPALARRTFRRHNCVHDR